MNCVDHLTVSTEIVKLLSLNTAADAVDKITEREAAVDKAQKMLWEQ